MDKEVEKFIEITKESFSIVRDPRVRTKRIEYSLPSLIIASLLAILCGANNLKEISQFIKSRFEWISSLIEFPGKPPSYGALWIVFALMNPEDLNKGFVAWIEKLFTLTKGSIIAIDGKALRGTAAKGKSNSFIHMVSMWACDAEVTLGSTIVDEKSNEIKSIPKLLEMFDLEGAIITIDAMGTQKEIAKKITAKKADFVLALKGNQSGLHNEIKNFFEQAVSAKFAGIDHQCYGSSEKGHGREEERTVTVVDNLDWLPQKNEWEGLQSIVMINSKRVIGEKVQKEVRYYISSLSADAKKLYYAIRSHWGIENSCHWTLDVSFREDTLKAREHNIESNLAQIRRMAINILKQDQSTKGGVEIKRKRAAWDPKFVLDLLGVKSF